MKFEWYENKKFDCLHLHVTLHITRNADVVNMNSFRKKYNNNNNLHGVMWYELSDR